MSLDPLYRIIGWMLAVFYQPTSSLGLATILLTIVIMLIQFPLTAKQARSMIQLQWVQPEIKKIQQKYKDDKAKQNEELLKFYQENKINPLAGCLPMIVTIPIGIAVFRTFSQGVQKHLPETGHFSGLYHDICRNTSVKVCTEALNHHTPSVMHFLGMNLNQTARQFSGASAIPYYIMIGLVALTGWYQVRQTKARQLQSGNAGPNAQMQAMTKIFPVFFAFICLGLNAGAILYFVISNVWRIGQQHLVIGKLYEQALGSSDVKPVKDPPKDAAGKDAGGEGLPVEDAPKPNGKAKPGGTRPGDAPKGQAPKRPDAKGSNGTGKSQGMSPGTRRKKRKR